MADVSVEQVADEPTAQHWQRIHNEIIPTDPLDVSQVLERSARHHLEVLHLGGEAVGCSTVRRPSDDEGAMVIARVLPSHRRQGLGRLLYERGLALAREWADDRPVETACSPPTRTGSRSRSRTASSRSSATCCRATLSRTSPWSSPRTDCRRSLR